MSGEVGGGDFEMPPPPLARGDVVCELTYESPTVGTVVVPGPEVSEVRWWHSSAQPFVANRYLGVLVAAGPEQIIRRRQR